MPVVCGIRYQCPIGCRQRIASEQPMERICEIGECWAKRFTGNIDIILRRTSFVRKTVLMVRSSPKSNPSKLMRAASCCGRVLVSWLHLEFHMTHQLVNEWEPSLGDPSTITSQDTFQLTTAISSSPCSFGLSPIWMAIYVMHQLQLQFKWKLGS